jgi:hypothetical protein
MATTAVALMAAVMTAAVVTANAMQDINKGVIAVF